MKAPWTSRFTAVVIAVTLLLGVTWTAQADTVSSPHFACYTALASEKFTPVSATLVDQFRETTVKVTKAANLCNPADKNGENPGAETHPDHLVAYAIAQSVAPKFTPVFGLQVEDQFGTRYVDALTPDRLLVPSATTLCCPPGVPCIPELPPCPRIDHFVCYTVRTSPGTPKFARVNEVNIVDQFGARQVDLTKLSRLCNPVNKNSEDPGTETHEQHLMCYETLPSKGSPKFSAVSSVLVDNQFGPQRLKATTPGDLCVPALVSPGSLPELDSYVSTLPESWRMRARQILLQCETDRAYRIPVLLVSYFPVVGSPQTGLSLDPALTGMNTALADIRAHVARITDHARLALALGSTYHGLRDADAGCSLKYDIVGHKEYLEALPVSNFEVPWNPGRFRPDYIQILNREHICDLVENAGLQEVWLWGYHHGNIEPAESNMAGPFGDVSNSERVPDMPVCARSYTLYNYNYGRGLGEALENHGHQIEAVLGHVDQHGLFADFGNPMGRPSPAVNSCGSVHIPPNAVTDYAWSETAVVQTDCPDWNPQGTGQVTSVSCADWTCADDGGATYKVWWMMNIPGRDNPLTLGGQPVRDWWDSIGDFDAVMNSGTGLLR